MLHPGRSLLWMHLAWGPGSPLPQPAPVYDASAAISAGLVLQGIYPRPIQAFLVSCAASKAPKSQWRSIKARYDALIEGWQAKMDLDFRFRSEVAGAEEGVSRGDEPDTVLQDLRKRFEDKYGEAVDRQTDTHPERPDST